eukprot:2210236-Prymnesium_polylepis.1
MPPAPSGAMRKSTWPVPPVSVARCELTRPSPPSPKKGSRAMMHVMSSRYVPSNRRHLSAASDTSASHAAVASLVPATNCAASSDSINSHTPSDATMTK